MLKPQLWSNHQYVRPFSIHSLSPFHLKAISSGDVCRPPSLRPATGNGWSLLVTVSRSVEFVRKSTTAQDEWAHASKRRVRNGKRQVAAVQCGAARCGAVRVHLQIGAELVLLEPLEPFGVVHKEIRDRRVIVIVVL